MNKEISERYGDFIKIVKVIEKLGASCRVEEAASEAEIAEYEQKTGYKLPDDYKDWLRLTKGIDFSPFVNISLSICMSEKAFDTSDGFKALIVGNAFFKDYYIDLDSGKYGLYDDDFGTTTFDSFEDMLDEMYFSDIEAPLDSSVGNENWVSIYDELFPEDK